MLNFFNTLLRKRDRSSEIQALIDQSPVVRDLHDSADTPEIGGEKLIFLGRSSDFATTAMQVTEFFTPVFVRLVKTGFIFKRVKIEFWAHPDDANPHKTPFWIDTPRGPIKIGAF